MQTEFMWKIFDPEVHQLRDGYDGVCPCNKSLVSCKKCVILEDVWKITLITKQDIT